MLTCPACLQNTTNTEQTGTYLKCANCGSYFLPAQKNSQEYFNEFYKDSKDIKRSLIRLFLFQGFRLVDWLLHPLAAYSKLNSILLKRRFLNDKRGNILEIGFGLGQNLMRCLKAGITIDGIDTSKVAVTHFQKKYPQFKEHVFSSWPKKKYTRFYANALFEHIDDPDKFFMEVKSVANKNSVYLFEFPSSKSKIKKIAKNDINFWDPCHRILYSGQGLEACLTRNGYKLIKIIYTDDYVTRVLSLLKAKGYNEYEYLRVPYLNQANGIFLLEFLLILFKALWKRSKLLNTQILFTAKS